MKIGFDNEKYLKIQSEHIKERILSLIHISEVSEDSVRTHQGENLTV